MEQKVIIDGCEMSLEEAEEFRQREREWEENRLRKMEGEPSWRRLHASDKDRFFQSYKFKLLDKEFTFNQGHANNVDVVGLTVWDGCLVLAKYFERVHSECDTALDGRTVLELGAGVGVLGICISLFGAKVTVTDCAWLVGIMKENAELNKDLAKFPVEVEELYWGRDLEKWKGKRYDYVVAADTVYQQELIPAQLKTLELVTDEKTEILYCFEEHNPESARKFWECVGEKFEWERVSVDEHHEEYRHPKITIVRLKKKPVKN
eukprot:TRINITY_DN16045_c0_g1_i1.p1 TRINITY_DN16045_c0_g1~~TRINITY_DN16045_c0_g1_i1.p1  ORF type:complete len:263 (-),score=61.85 TRINITY_DN16045_c0_g1_i1:48-836(-)